MAKKSLIPDFPASGKKSAKAGNNRLISRPRVKTNAPAVDIGGLINNERKYLPGGFGSLNATKRTKTNNMAVKNVKKSMTGGAVSGGVMSNVKKSMAGGITGISGSVKPNVKKRNSNNSGKMMATPLVKKLK